MREAVEDALGGLNGISRWEALVLEDALKEVPTGPESIFRDYGQPPSSDLNTYVVTNRAGKGGGETRKARNLFFRLGDVLERVAVRSAAAAGAFSAGVPWLGATLALAALRAAHSIAAIDLTEVEAGVVWAMWKHRGQNAVQPRSRLLHLVNQERAAEGYPPVTAAEVDLAISRLARLRCVVVEKGDPEMVQLIEWVSVNYP